MTFDTAPGTRALLELEDRAPEVLFERLPGTRFPLWPQVRTHFMVAMQDLDFGGSEVGASEARRFAAWKSLVSAMLPSRSDARGLRGARPIVYLMGGGTVHRLADGRERNWLVGDYLESYPDRSALLQWRELSDAAPAFMPTRSLAAAQTRAAAYARLSRGRRSASFERIGPLVREFAQQLGTPISDDRLDQIVASATYAESIRPHLETQVLRAVDRMEPRVVVMEDASYGSWSSLISAFKDRGITVVEPQHGWIGPTHGAYNFGAAMRSPELAAGLPDELLTFGEFWSSGVRVPYRTTEIGKPHLEAASARAVPWDDRSNEVLVVSSVANPEETSEFVMALRERLPGTWRVRFRPHPLERPSLGSRYPAMVSDPRVEIDENPDVYDSLASARGVVGVASTVLFEAVALGCRVFVRDSPFAKYYVGDLFGPLVAGPENAAQVVAGLQDFATPAAAEMRDAFWRPGAVANFRAWMERQLQN